MKTLRPLILLLLVAAIFFLIFEDRIMPAETGGTEPDATQVIATYQAEQALATSIIATYQASAGIVISGTAPAVAGVSGTTSLAAGAPAGTPSPTPSRTPMPSPTPLPTLTPHSYVGGNRPQPYLANYRLVTYYGVPHSPILGAIGNGEPEEVLGPLRSLAQQYQALSTDGRTVLPTFHIISTVADPEPGPNSYYSHWTSIAILDQWIAVANENNMAVILDIQPGRSDLLFEVERLRDYLMQPNIHLAIDPEYFMDAEQTPGSHIGDIDGQQINAVQEILDQIALEIGVNKMLLVHQFARGMIKEKYEILDYPHVDLVIDTDGYGIPDTKLNDYRVNAGDPGFEFGGLKLFYVWDDPLLTPEQVMRLEPMPAVIVYQ
jgi:hypothetical protein